MFIQEITSEECWEAMAKAGFGRLACASDNQPYVVPFHFSVAGSYVYSFSLPGQKLDWMRKNPRVCVEIDNVTGRNDWMSIVAMGWYEELPDTPAYQSERLHAHQLLLRSHAMWWQPGAVTVTSYNGNRGFEPVFYRIKLEHVSGYRGVPAPDEVTATPT